jgi:glycosyltransferase involved in cell wall biosynthesis
LSASVINAVAHANIPMILTATDFWFLCSRNTLLQSDGTLCTGPENAWKCAKCKLADAKVYRWPNAILPESIVSKLLLSVGKVPAITRQRGLRGMHGDWDQRHEFLMKALGKVDQIVTASHLVESYFIQYGVPAEKIVFSRYGFDTSWAERHQEKTPSDVLRLGFIGNILSIKGPDILLKAVKALDSDLPLRLKIYGNLEKVPEYGQQLRDIAGVDDRITFEGTFPYHDIGKVLENINVLVVPSIWYDFPLIIPSALATKTPVIATDMPGMNELIRHEVDGLLFARYDVQGLTHQINRLFAEPELLQTLRAGIQPVKTVETMTEEYLARYMALLEAESPIAAQAR